LSIAGILILMVDSSAVFSISFQLSFIAVVFIVCGVSLVNNYLFGFKKKWLAKLGLMIGVTFFAGLGTLPLTAHYFNIVSHVQLISNLIAIPVLGFVVLPLGLIALSCFSFFPVFAAVILQVCSQLILFLTRFSEFLVSIPYSWSRTATLQWITIAAIYFVFISFFLLFKDKRKPSAAFFIIALLFLIFNFSNDWLKKTANTNLTITIIDVGQGSSALIQTPAGNNILVDGGGFSDGSSFDTGRFIIAPFLWQKRIQSLDYVILTHPESDHLNGLVFILQNFNVHTLIKNLDYKNSMSYTTLIKTCKKKNIRIWTPFYKTESLALGKVELIFFNLFNNTLSNGFNNNSLVFKVIYNEFSMLFPGDILMEREKSLSVHHRHALHSDILLSPHHGSSTSNTKFFLDKVQPKSVIISCARQNKYGFPHEKVLKRYARMGINIFRTDEDGATFISSDGKDHIIKTYKGG
ncbi:MAG: ComEC/Rec2 family competence protein, partial [Proteobacteria bacterium]|nr:ComEC/Rec2 family competence protein [Pseudomonadota bacterium]